jgi:hypothetical protein
VDKIIHKLLLTWNVVEVECLLGWPAQAEGRARVPSGLVLAPRGKLGGGPGGAGRGRVRGGRLFWYNHNGRALPANQIGNRYINGVKAVVDVLGLIEGLFIVYRGEIPYYLVTVTCSFE